MGWGNCGVDSQGRPIGYMHDAECDHPGCNEKIDRGLDYACGGMHGEDENSCEKYFCSQHRMHVEVSDAGKSVCLLVCTSCADLLEKTGKQINN